MTRGPDDRNPVCIGRVVGVRGVDGSLKIHSYTRDRTAIFNYRRWLLKSANDEERFEVFELGSGEEQGRGLVARLHGVEDRDRAAGLVGTWICVDADELPPPTEGEYYWHQLEGLEVVTLDGTVLGKVAYLIETGANDVVVVRGDRERLIPYTDPVIKEVDLQARIMRVDWDADF